MSDSDSDEWGMEELVIPSKSEAGEEQNKQDENDEGDWDVTIPKKVRKGEASAPGAPKIAGEPMIIVDVTQLDATVHSHHDRNSVNDAAAASAWRKKIELGYNRYARDTTLLENGAVIPCGSSVWRDALVQLRDKRKGHYFCPVFPPKK